MQITLVNLLQILFSDSKHKAIVYFWYFRAKELLTPTQSFISVLIEEVSVTILYVYEIYDGIPSALI
jgi:hypothetical protein